MYQTHFGVAEMRDCLVYEEIINVHKFAQEVTFYV